VLMTNDRPTVELLLGAVAAGARIVSLPVPSRSADPEIYLEFIRAACEAQGATEIVVCDQYAELVSLSGVAARPHAELSSRPVAAPSGRGFELVQYSSGSTSQPKAVLLEERELCSNIAAIIETLAPQPGDCTVSWLPLSHDMGLVGMLLTSIAAASPAWVGPGDIVLLDPTDFLRNPGLWLDAMSEFRCTFTAAPDFGFRLCLEQPRPGTHDLSSVRCAIVGGEPVRAATLRSFAERFAASRFPEVAFCPAYGMAEIGLAASLTPVRSLWRSLELQSVPLADHQVVRSDGTGGGGTRITELVSCGLPVPGYQIRCEAPPGEVGPILIHGPSIGRDGLTGASYADGSGWLRTGDLGTMDDGALFVTGRTDDYITTNGRTTFAPPIEDALGSLDGIRAGRVALLGLPSGDWIAVAELADGGRLSPDEQARLRRDINRTIVSFAGAHPTDIVLIKKGHLPMTSSGKLQRRETRRRYVAGELHLANT
jgi:fatty-acyl-CoA synthase